MRVLIVFAALAASGSALAEPPAIRVSVDQDVIRFVGTVPDQESALRLHEMVAAVDPLAICLDEILISPVAPALPDQAAFTGLLLELSHSVPRARISLFDDRLAIYAATDSKVAFAAMNARLEVIKATGWEVENAINMVPTEALPPVIDFNKGRAVAKSRRPEFEVEVFDPIAFAAKIAGKKKSVAGVEVANDNVGPVSEVTPDVEVEIPKKKVKPKGPGVSFAPDSFVVQGDQLIAARKLGRQLAGRTDFGETEEKVLLRVNVSNPAESNKVFQQWLASERTTAVRRLLVAEGAVSEHIHIEMVNDPDLPVNHVSVLIPERPVVRAVAADNVPAVPIIRAQAIGSIELDER